LRQSDGRSIACHSPETRRAALIECGPPQFFAEGLSAARKRALLACQAVERRAGFSIAAGIAASWRIRTIAILIAPASTAAAIATAAVCIALALTIAVIAGTLGILAIAGRPGPRRLTARRMTDSRLARRLNPRGFTLAIVVAVVAVDRLIVHRPHRIRRLLAAALHAAV
jgi:hypothetical protein